MDDLEGDRTSIQVRRAVGGDRGSLAWLVAHLDPLLRAQVRMRLGVRSRNEADVDDLVAEVWVVALCRLESIEPRGGRYAPSFVAFLASTATNLCNAFLRRSIRAHGTGDGSGSGSASGSGAVERLVAETRGVVTRVDGRDVRELVDGVLDRMSAERREVLVLRLFEQRSNAEIAEREGAPANTIAVRYRRALAELRDLLPAGVFGDVRELCGAGDEA